MSSLGAGARRGSEKAAPPAGEHHCWKLRIANSLLVRQKSRDRSIDSTVARDISSTHTHTPERLLAGRRRRRGHGARPAGASAASAVDL